MKNFYDIEAEKPDNICKKYILNVKPYREMDGDFFKVCRGIFILKDSKAIHLYIYLCSCYNKKTEKVFPSYDTISKATGLKRNTISDKLKLLKKLKLIKIMKRKNGTNYNNCYTINYIQDITIKNRIDDNLEVYEHLDLDDESILEDINIDKNLEGSLYDSKDEDSAS